jgi:hypothetical protein
MAFKLFFKSFVTILVAPIITGIRVHFMFHIHCISIHKLLYFSFFPASFYVTFLSAGIAICISTYVFSFMSLIIISGLFSITSVFVCISWFKNTVTSSCLHSGLDVWVCVPLFCRSDA